MKHIFILFLAVPLLFASCKKDDRCPYTQSAASAPAAERDYLRQYLAANSIIATEQISSGVFYSITTQGTGSMPDICSNITVKYTGSFIPSGTVFDGTTASMPTATFALGTLIEGWKKALPLLNSGGKITLYIPPSLGYGQNNVRDPQTQQILIPGGSYLKFDLELLNVL